MSIMHWIERSPHVFKHLSDWAISSASWNGFLFLKFCWEILFTTVLIPHTKYCLSYTAYTTLSILNWLILHCQPYTVYPTSSILNCLILCCLSNTVCPTLSLIHSLSVCPTLSVYPILSFLHCLPVLHCLPYRICPTLSTLHYLSYTVLHCLFYTVYSLLQKQSYKFWSLEMQEGEENNKWKALLSLMGDLLISILPP